jgi:hypothetical protein
MFDAKRKIMKTHLSALLVITVLMSQSTQSLAQQADQRRGSIGLTDSSAEALPEESPLNTASMKSGDGKTVKLVIIGDRLPMLFVNGNKVSKIDLLLYEDYMDTLTGVIQERQRAEALRIDAVRERIRNQIMTDLVEKKLVAGKENIQSYYLTAKSLTVNGKIQDPGSFTFFRNKYVKSQDRIFYYDRETPYTFHQ